MTHNSAGPSKLLWKLFAGYAVLMVAVLAVFAVLIVQEVEEFHRGELTDQLDSQAITLRSLLRGQLDPARTDWLDGIAKEAGVSEADGLRVTIVSADGTVLGDSQADISQMGSHADRDEIREAFEEGRGESTRWSETLSRTLNYVAVRVGPKDDPEGVVRVALATRTIASRAQTVRRMIWTVAVLAMVATALFALILARLWTGPIRNLMRVATRLSRGDLSARIRLRGSDELARLAKSLNKMGDHLGRQVGLIEGQKQTLEALLDQIGEGVIVAGPDGKIVLCNPSAAALLRPEDVDHLAARSWVGRPVEQCVPNHSLQLMLASDVGQDERGETSLDEVSSSESESNATHCGREGRGKSEVRFEIRRPDGIATMLARASDIKIPAPMTDSPSGIESEKTIVGRILTLTDITEIARTIQMKTDFVANASHELRTPLATIRAAIDTVMHLNSEEEVESARRFLQVIDRHSARLEALVEDLLALSRVESTSREPKPKRIELGRLCAELKDKWDDRLSECAIDWSCSIASDLEVIIADEHLLRTVLDNLVDNATKFTGPGGVVSLSIVRDESSVAIEVSDTGCGIPVQDHERVFERFYQVAQSRSDADGPQARNRGTGLGLAIVRHAVASMGGTVSLSSKLGEGTKVVLRIPQPD